jgi:hypothetical protein
MGKINEKGCEIYTEEGAKEMKEYRKGEARMMELFNIKKL